ncbi:cobalamin biosynthesis protein [Nocardia stercoris]|uniref:cobalamin biosynthesis protein n=1 Tax=Nocardia stercoris TaxID=2483361 RepID=UPI0022774333|nr:cobalamin biosynthesis protein [Nocardia stercoris]
MVGIGLRPGAAAPVILAAVRDVLGGSEIRCLATVDRRAAESGLTTAAAELAVPVRSFTPEQLAEVAVPNPAERVTRALGTPSVAEAAAILASGHGHLLVPKTTVRGVTLAVATPGTSRPGDGVPSATPGA